MTTSLVSVPGRGREGDRLRRRVAHILEQSAAAHERIDHDTLERLQTAVDEARAKSTPAEQTAEPTTAAAVAS